MPSIQMLEKVMTYIHNWFLHSVTAGAWEITDGTVVIPGLLDGQYFRIVGSVFNDGLHQYPANDLADETFDGQVWGLAVPKDFIALVDEIEEWETKYGAAAASPYASESFENYSYSLGSDVTSGGNTDPATGWQRQFMARLIPYRKLA